MHTFTPRWSEAWRDDHDPNPFDHLFRDAADLAAFAELDRLSLWRTWPEIWHLDSDGFFTCMTKGTTSLTVRSIADRPQTILGCRLAPSPDCPDNWVILEHRMAWQRDGMDVTDIDATAFVRLRRELAEFGITLLDVVIVNDDLRWWSLEEMVNGSTAWAFDRRTGWCALPTSAAAAQCRAGATAETSPEGELRHVVRLQRWIQRM